MVEAATVSQNSDVISIDTTSLQESIALELVYHIADWYDKFLSISFSNLRFLGIKPLD